MPQPAQHLPSAGWHRSPEGGWRWWDGQQWTAHSKGQPWHDHAPSVGRPAGLWEYLVAIVIPIVGFVIGAVYLGQRREGGVSLMVVSVVAFVFWAAYLSSGTA